MQRRIYLETSLWGFYHDRSEANRWRREAVRMLLDQVRAGRFAPFVSTLVLDEITASDEPFRTRDLDLLQSVGVEVLQVNPADLARLADLYQAAGILPERHRADLLHAACVSMSDLHILVTYNCRHLANYRVVQGIWAVNLMHGYRTDFLVMTPEEVIDYDETADG